MELPFLHGRTVPHHPDGQRNRGSTMTGIRSHRRAGSNLRIALLIVILSGGMSVRGEAQEERVFRPEVAVRSEDYAAVRREFRTTLRKRAPSPQEGMRYRPPKYVTEVDHGSPGRPLRAWLSGGEAHEGAPPAARSPPRSLALR